MNDFIIAKIQEEEKAKEEAQTPLYLDLPLEVEYKEEKKEIEEERGVFIINY